VNDLLFWSAIISLLVSSLAAIGSRALREFSLTELEELLRKRNSPLRQSEILRHYDVVAVAVECLNTAALAAYSVCITLWIYLDRGLAAHQDWGRLTIAILGAAVALWCFDVWIPWAVSRLWAAPFMLVTWRLWRGISIVLWPLLAAARLVDILLHRLAGRTPQEPSEDLIEDEIRTIVSEGHREGLLEDEAREMIEKVIGLHDIDVAKVMTPRTDVIMIRLGMPWTEIIDFVVESGHTRIPVYDKTRDNVIGILNAKDLLAVLARAADRPLPDVGSILRRPHFVPATKKLDDLLAEFRKTRNHIAVVLDEYGGVSGLVTIEDVLEEIVGDIADEYDEDQVEEIRDVDERTSEMSARVHLDEINERLGIHLPEEEEFDTIGGFVFHELGRIPTPGEEVSHDGVRIQVVSATRRQIEKVRIILPGPRKEAVASERSAE